jgi:hypothetical protein
LIDVTSFRIDDGSSRTSSTHETAVAEEIPDHPRPRKTEISFAVARAVRGMRDRISNRSASL